MMPPESTPKLPLWIFFILDAALVGAAGFIAYGSTRPLTSQAILAIAACVIAGALVLLVPLVSRYERQKNEILDERQRELEALARTVATSAEQIGIAATGLHQIAELAQRNLRQAEQLPHKLQEKIGEFQSMLANAADAEKEELEKELIALRTTESERLESISTRIFKATGEFAKLESATQQNLAGANEALAKLAMGTAAAIGKAQAAAEQALAQARTEAARGVGEAAGTATRAIDAAKSAALTELETRLIALVERISREAGARLPAFAPEAPPVATAAVAPVEPPSADNPDNGAPATPKAETTAHPPKRPRKPRRDDNEDTSTSAASPPAESNPAETAEKSATAPDPTGTAIVEPPPVPAAQIAEVAPVAPDTADPFVEGKIETPATTAPAPVAMADAVASIPVAASVTEPVTQIAAPAALTAPNEAAAPRKARAKKVVTPADESATKDELDLGLSDAPAAEPASDRTLSSDGATRLLVTAYIGIGNRLFIRGAGPGLTWEKGVPLQFVSIGKWRWETNDATAAVEFKVYKNDEIECTALGTQTVEPGYQQEVRAGF